MANTGPLGKPRSSGTGFLLSIVTVGIYGWYWLYVNHDEIKEHSGQGVGGGVGLLLGIVAFIPNLFILPSEIKKMYEQDGRKSPVSAATAIWGLLLFFPWFFKCQSALNNYWTTKSVTAPAAAPPPAAPAPAV